MYPLKLLKKHLIDSQIFVSLMGTLFAVFFMWEQNTFRFPKVILIFITFFSGYLYTKYQNALVFSKIFIFNVICGIGSVIFIYLNHNEIKLLKWLIIVILGMLYDSSFLRNYIRKIPLLKIFYVGLTWALINAWLVLPEFDFPIFIISILFISALVLPFDIRDKKVDSVVTFPRLIGVQNTKYLAYFMVIFACLLSIFYLQIDFSIAFYLTTIITFILIYFSETNNQESYFSFWVEFCSGLPFLFSVLLK